MKYSIHTLTLLLAGWTFFNACSKEESKDDHALDGRESVAIDVSYSIEGTKISSLSFNHSAARAEIEVSVNNDNLKWNLQSNRSWCRVVEAEHKGSGAVSLEIDANEELEPRETATLTFVAGEYRGFQINVSQTATAFIISQPYFVVPFSGGNACVVKVTMEAGTDWNISGTDWLNVNTLDSSIEDGMETVSLEITPSVNTDDSRYGSVKLTSGLESDNISFYQFGTDLDYDEEGNIFFASGAEAVLSFTAPAYLVKSVQAGSFVTSSVLENGDGTSTVSLTLAENLTDCSETRSVDVSILLDNISASVVSLPAIVQDYSPAHGLVTAKGMTIFAEAVASGSSTEEWERDGVVTLLQDIDMAGISGWPGIGTAENPFAGKFEGGGHTLTNLKETSSGLFNCCKDASVQNLTLGKGSSLYYNEEFSGNGYFGGIVSYAENTVISNCAFAGNIEYAGMSEDDTPSYVGGVAGWCDAASTVRGAKMSGNLVISSPADAAATCYAGGVAGLCEGTLSNNEFQGTLSFSSGVATAYLGGIESRLTEGVSASSNSFMGEISISGSAGTIYAGGLYAAAECSHSFDNTSDKSISVGEILLNSFASNSNTRIFLGGYVGFASDGIDISFKGYEAQTNFFMDQTVDRLSGYVCIGGVLGGCDPDAPVNSASFENIINHGSYTVDNLTTVVTRLTRGFMGGVAGLVNGDATFRNCVNNGAIGEPKDKVTNFRGNNTKNFVQVMGGIAGVVIGGDASFTDCENKGAVTNYHYSNIIYGGASNGWYTACTAAGILGAFDFKPSSVSGSLTMTGCTNNAVVASFRGISGGVLGFARNASISNCNNYGDMATSNSNAPNKGGIAAWLMNSTVSNCIAKCNVFCSNPASAIPCPAGILSVSYGGGVTINDCKWYGTLSVGNGTPCPGGLVSTAEDDTVVSNCKFGGVIAGSDISENNVSTYAVGNNLGTVSGIAYWNGN